MASPETAAVVPLDQIPQFRFAGYSAGPPTEGNFKAGDIVLEVDVSTTTWGYRCKQVTPSLVFVALTE